MYRILQNLQYSIDYISICFTIFQIDFYIYVMVTIA